MKGKVLTLTLSLLSLQAMNAQSVYPGLFEDKQKISSGIVLNILPSVLTLEMYVF